MSSDRRGVRTSGPTPRVLRMIRTIDVAGDRCGRAVSVLILPMIAIVSWEVFARYVLSAPTLWAFDLTYMRPATC